MSKNTKFVDAGTKIMCTRCHNRVYTPPPWSGSVAKVICNICNKSDRLIIPNDKIEKS